MKEHFVEFLKKNNALNAFVENLKRLNNLSYEKYLNETKCDNYIFDAFMWSDTKEGYKFWDDLDKKWDVVLKHPDEADKLSDDTVYNARVTFKDGKSIYRYASSGDRHKDEQLLLMCLNGEAKTSFSSWSDVISTRKPNGECDIKVDFFVTRFEYGDKVYEIGDINN